MRKDVLISLLAITGAPVAALADADVVIDKTAWTGDDLTVSEDGSVTVSTGKEVSIEKELVPGKYMLQDAPELFTDNAKIVAVYKGKEYAPGVAFTIDGDAPAKVRVKVRAVTPGEFKFSGVKFTLIFDFAAPVKELGAQLGEIVSGTSDYFRRTDAWTKGKDGKPSLEMQVADYASQLDIIEKGDYDVYVKNHLWQGKNSPELRALAEGIGALAKVVEKANDNENAYFSAQNAYEAAEYQFRSFSSTWYTVAEEIRATYQADYNKIQQSINDFKALAREKYDAGEAKELKTAEFTENFNRMLNELEANIGVSDAAWINIYAVYQDGLRVFNAAQEEIHTQMPDDGNYADWNEEALNAMRSAWKKVSDLYKTIDADKTKASEQEENFRTLKEAQVLEINATKDEYLAKHADAEAKKKAADQLLADLEDDFLYLEKSEDVNLKYANRVKEIRTAINALKDKVAKDYKAPHNIRTASYDADRDAIQAKISSLRSDAGAIIQNYENYQKLLKALGTETGLQKKLDDAKAAVAKMKPAAEGDTYDMAAHFQKTAAGLQKTIDEIKAAVEKGYQEKTLTVTVRGDFQSQIDAAAMAVVKYQDDATAKADAYDANIKNFDQLTIDYNTVTERIKAAQDYYGAFNVASSRIEANIASTFDQVKRWQADLTRQNASQEMSKRIYGLTIGEDKQWYDCHSIKILSIDGIYNAANQAEVDAIKADIVAIETQKREALDNLTGTAADEVKAYYDEHCKNLAKELDDLLKEFDENATPAEAKKDAGLLALEKKVAQARMGLIKLVNAELIEGVASSLEMLVSQAELSYSDVNITYDGVYTPVKVEYKSALDACRNELDGVKNLITSYGDEIVTYKTKVIHLLNVLIDRMGATRTDIMETNKPYVAHAKAMKDLQNAYDALVAEQTRVKELIASYQHASEVREYSDWEGLGEMFYFEGGKSYMENYEKQFFNEASEKAEVVSDVLEQAAKTLEEGPVSAILTDNQVESYKDGCLNEAYAKLATVEAFGAWKETQSVYQVNVNSARYAMENSFNKSGTNIYDEDNTLWEQFNNLERACQNFDNYRNFVDIYRILPTKDINGNAWLNPDGSEAWQKEINYSKDEEYGVKLVAATSESLVESMNALRTSIEENTYVLGDVTEDGVVLTDDYLAVLNALLDPETLEGGKVFAAADVNRDGKISIADVTLIAAKVTNGLWPSLGGTLNAPMVGSENLTVSAEDNNGVQRIAINLENRKDYVACQMDIILPAGMTVVGESVGNRANGHALYSKDIDGVHRVVISTIENNSFTNGSAILYLDVQGGSIDKVALDKVIFAEANGRETTITGSDATGISGMEAEGSLKQKIYTVGGQLLDKVKQGINIVRNANGKTQKVTGK